MRFILFRSGLVSRRVDYIKRYLLTHEDKSTNYIICAQNLAHTWHLIHPVNTKHNLLTLGTSLGDSTSF